MPTAAERATALRPLGETLCATLRAEADRLGFTTPVPLSSWESASFELQRDPASGTDTLAALWKDARGHQIGCVLIHGDGSFYAEHDVVRPHPHKPRWFVEAVSAWGRDDEIKSEPRLLPMPE